MEKISGILPSSPRVASVDMKEAAPVRPGTPAFGRPEGVSSLRKARIGETADTAAALNRERLDWKSKDLQNAAMARDLSERFFKGNTRAAESVSDIDEPSMIVSVPVASRPAGFKSDELDRITRSGAFAGAPMGGISDGFSDVNSNGSDAIDSLGPLDADAGAEQPEGLYPRGSFIDFRA